MDTNGFSDPFAIVYYGDRELFRTKVSRKHSAPTTTHSHRLSQSLVAHVSRARLPPSFPVLLLSR